jgi:nitrogen fixation/metabolism regulation signal transduction histidine kinase
MSGFSLQGRFIFLLAAIVIAAVLAAVWLTLTLDSWTLVVPVTTILALLAVVIAVKSWFRPVNETLQALRSGVASFKDHDYSVKIADTRDDELGQLVSVYNDLAATLRDERFALFQRELLLDTVIRSSAVAVIIANLNGTIVYSNREAAAFLSDDRRLEGHKLLDLCEQKSTSLREALERRRDGLLTLNMGSDTEIYHLTCRQFNLNAQIHDLVVFKKMTREIARREVDTWKKVIRVITHELNNSLAPIASLTRSARLITERGEKLERLGEIFDSIGSRAGHLQSFIEQYSRFARLPKPTVQTVGWKHFVDGLGRLCRFRLLGDLPATDATFDPVQMEQVMINLVKNAMESGSAPDEVCLRVLQNNEEILIAVEDRGTGLGSEQMKMALLPFYSTKREGTGLGLPLCREIVESHGGSFQLFNREHGGLSAVCKLPIVAMKSASGDPPAESYAVQ